MARGEPPQPAGQGPRNQAGFAGDPHPDQRGDQRQRDRCCSRQQGLRRGWVPRPGTFPGSRLSPKKGGDPHKVIQRGELLHVSRIDTLVDERARQEDRRGHRSGRQERELPKAQGQSRDRQRQARLSAFCKNIFRRALAAAGEARRQDAAPAVGRAPEPRTRPTAMFFTSTS